MFKKRLLVLTLLLCSLAFVASEEPARAGAWCTCAALSCNVCQYRCDPDPGTTQAQIDAAAWSCCQDAWRETGPAMACGPGGVGQ